MKKAVLSLSVLAAIASTGAAAQDNSGVYLGGRIGASFFETTCADTPTFTCDNTNVGGGAIIGYDFGNMFAIEGTYDYLGNVAVGSSTTDFLHVSGDLTSFTLAPKISYNLTDRTRAYAKVGAAWWGFDSVRGQLDDIAYLGALGLDHRATDLINLRLEYQYTGGIDKSEPNKYDFKGDNHLVTAGLTLHFGRRSTPVVEEVIVPVEPVEVVETYEPEPIINEILVPELFGAVEFGFDRSQLTGDAINLLQPILQRMQDIPESTAVVSGYTDNIGPEEFNENLSLERAQTVANYFVTNGIDPNRIIVQGLGESNPVATNDTAAGRMLNRRVEVYSPELIVIEQ